MGPAQHDTSAHDRQEPASCRSRICLLKGCERWFSPVHPLARYCCAACREAARRWSRWQAARRYRASEQGKQCRRQQACRYRERVRQRREEPVAEAAACEGHQESAASEKIPCCRPGCYVLFAPEPRSPLKKFCCALCQRALRRVRQREARWRGRTFSPASSCRGDRLRSPPGASR